MARVGAEVEGKSSKYVDTMSRSLFCLCPLGFAVWSPRIYESVIMGCIPVIIGDGIRLPFDWELDWRDFSVRHFSDALEDLGGPVDVQRRGKRPRDYAFDNGHFKLSKHLFTKDMETHLRRIYRSPIHDTFTPKHIGRLVAHWLNEEDAERVLYNKETVEDSLLT